jgi:hypothetical protein
MARGKTLGELVSKLRIAARYDPNPALSKNVVPLLEQTIRDTQERLYDQFDWPFLKVYRDKVLSAGERYYDVPDDMNLERIIAVDVLVGSVWSPVERGITLDDLSQFNSDQGARSDPVLKWDVIDTGDGEQLEVWPIPASNGGTLRITGFRQLSPLVEDSDRADLDDQLIVSFAAAEVLAGRNDNEAQLKLSQGTTRLKMLQGRVTKNRRGGFVLGGGPRYDDDCRGYPHTVAIVGAESGGVGTTGSDDPGDLAGLLG